MNNLRRLYFGIAAVVITVLVTYYLQHENRISTDALRSIDYAERMTSANANTESKKESNTPSITQAEEPSSPKTTWRDAFLNSNDYFEFAKVSAAAALDNDARAQYYLSVVLKICNSQVGMLKPFNGNTPEEKLAEMQSRLPGIQKADQNAQEKRLALCRQFFEASPFDGLTTELRDMPADYWLKRAANAGDPIAGVDLAIQTLGSYPAGHAVREELLDNQIANYLLAAAGSQEPQAMYAIGSLFSRPDISTNNLQGPAWFLAACQSGFDCSMNNPDIGHGCVSNRYCDSTLTLFDTLKLGLGDKEFARAYAMAQDITFKVNSSDWEGLGQYLEIKRESE